MSENKKKHITVLIAWAALQAYYLAFHFSWGSFSCFAIALIYLFCTTVLGKKQDNIHVVETIGNLIGTTFAAFLGYHVVTTIFPAFQIPENADFSGAFTAINSQLVDKIDSSGFRIAFSGTASPIMLVAAVVFFLLKIFAKRAAVKILYQYLWRGCLFAALIHTNYRSKEILILYAVCTLVFVACDILSCQQNGKPYKAGKRWYTALNVLLIVVLILQPDALAPFTQKGYMEYYFITSGFKWYTALYILAVLVAAGIFMVPRDASTEAKSVMDIFVFWNAVCVLVTLFFMTRFHVGYWWVVALIYGICVTVVLVAFSPIRVDGNEKLRDMDFLFLPVVSIGVIITVIAGHYGRLLAIWALVGGGLLIAHQLRQRSSEDGWVKDARFYSMILLVVGVVAAVFLWGFNRLGLNFLILLGMLVVALAFVWIISSDSGLFAKRSQLMQIISVALFVVLCISLCCKNGSKIKITTDESDKIVVDVSARKNREIETIEYYWLESYLLLDDRQEGFPQEVLLPDEQIPEQDGRLRVVVTDNYGSMTERIYWVHSNRYMQSNDEIDSHQQ